MEFMGLVWFFTLGRMLLYFYDIFSDIVFNFQLWANCHYNYVYVSLCIFAFSILVSFFSVLSALKKQTENIDTHMGLYTLFYPYYLVKETVKELVATDFIIEEKKKLALFNIKFIEGRSS